MPGHMGAAGWSSYGLAASGWPHDYHFCSGPRLSLEGSVGMVGLLFNILLGLLVFLCHPLSTLLPSAFLGQPVCSPVRHLHPGTSSTSSSTTLSLLLREHVKILHTASLCRLPLQGVWGGFSRLPLEPTWVQRRQACST